MAKGDSSSSANTGGSGTTDFRSQGSNQQQSPWWNNRQSQYHNNQRYNYSGQPSYQWGNNQAWDRNLNQGQNGQQNPTGNQYPGTGDNTGSATQNSWWNPPSGSLASMGGGKGGNSQQSGQSAGVGSGAEGSNSRKYQDLAKQAVGKGLSGQQAVDWVNSQAPGAAQFANAGQHWDPNKLVWYDKGGGYGKFQYAGDDGNWEYKSEGGQPWYVNNLGGGTAAFGTGGGGKNG